MTVAKADNEKIAHAITARWNRYRAFEDMMDAIGAGDLATAGSMLGDPEMRAYLDGDAAAERDVVAELGVRGNPMMLEMARNRLSARPELIHQRGMLVKTLLHDAAAEWCVQFAEILLDMGADPNARDRFGHSPLYYAANRFVANDADAAGVATVEVLVRAGADLDAISGPSRCAPLHMAARRGSLAIAKALLDHGADIEVEDSKGETPLRRAVNCGKPPMVALLLARGANPDSPDHNGRTPRDAARGPAILRMLPPCPS